MNRPRRKADATHNKDESYEDYKADLKREESKLKEYLKGRLVWVSSMIMPDPKDKEVMPLLRRLVKLPVRRTFNRSLGHEQRTSLIDQERKKKVLKELEKEGIL